MHRWIFQPLPKDAARSEVLTFLAQQHDAHLFLVANIWDHIIGAEPETFEGASWHAFSERFLEAVERGLKKQMESTLGDQLDSEVIPRRSMALMLERRRAHFLVDMRLMMRRLAHYMAVSVGQRMEWQRMMTRTRCLDGALKELFTEGVETPMAVVLVAKVSVPPGRKGSWRLRRPSIGNPMPLEMLGQVRATTATLLRP